MTLEYQIASDTTLAVSRCSDPSLKLDNDQRVIELFTADQGNRMLLTG
jgi:hypothetical protein